MYGIRSLQNGGAPKKLGKAEKYIPPELRPQAGALVDLIKWIKSNPYRAARDVAESFGPQADIKGMVDSYGSAVQNFRQGNIGAGLLDAAYVPANAMTLALPGSASGMRRAAEGLGGGAGKKADDLPMDEALRLARIRRGVQREEGSGGSLRDRYASILREVSGGKDHRRIRLTPDRIDAAKAVITREFDPSFFGSREEYLDFLAASPTKQMVNATDFARTMLRAGEKVRFKMPDGPMGSLYVRVGDKGSVRFSDHPQPYELGAVVGGYSKDLGRRHMPSTYSVDPASELSVADVIQRFLPDALPMDEASRMARAREAASAMGLRIDNPGDDWLERKIQNAAEKRAKSEDFTVGGTLGGVDGVTGYFKDFLRIRPEALRDVKGAMGEERFRGGEKLQRLRESIEREGYRDDSPILIAVREDGTPFVLEGNTRIQEAIESGRPSIQVELRYLRGAEDVDGPLSPDKLPDFLAPDDLRASERAQEAIRGQADPIEQVAKESYARQTSAIK